MQYTPTGLMVKDLPDRIEPDPERMRKYAYDLFKKGAMSLLEYTDSVIAIDAWEKKYNTTPANPAKEQ